MPSIIPWPIRNAPRPGHASVPGPGLLLALCLLLAALAGPAAAETQPPLVIGLVYNLTGDMASIDLPGMKGADLAIHRINEAGGIAGRLLEAAKIDGQSNVTAIRKAVTSLMATRAPVAVCGLNDTTLAMAAAPPVMAAGRPLVTAGATWQGLPEMFGPNFFMVPFGDDAQAVAMARFASEHLRSAEAVILGDQGHDFTRILSTFFRKGFQARGGLILDEIPYTPSMGGLGSQMQAFKALPRLPDAVFAATAPGDVPRVLTALRGASFRGPVLSGDGFDTPLLDALAPDLAGTVYFATHVALDKPTPAVQAFVRAYQDRYGSPPDSAFAALGYDAVMLVADALRRAGSDDPAALRAALAATRDFPGVTGTISYPAGSRVPRKPVDIIRLQNGTRTFAAEITPE